MEGSTWGNEASCKLEMRGLLISDASLCCQPPSPEHRVDGCVVVSFLTPLPQSYLTANMVVLTHRRVVESKSRQDGSIHGAPCCTIAVDTLLHLAQGRPEVWTRTTPPPRSEEESHEEKRGAATANRSHCTGAQDDSADAAIPPVALLPVQASQEPGAGGGPPSPTDMS